jgi:sodium-coupled neutral amino acid transporter 11
MAIIVVTVLIEGPTLPADLKGDPASHFTIIDSGFFEAVGVISFAYVCHHNSLLIYGSLATPTLDRWNTVTHISTGLSVVASLIMAVAGYSVFVSAWPRYGRPAMWAELDDSIRRIRLEATSSIIFPPTVS